MSNHQQIFNHIVHSFNARTMSWKNIVETFVPPPDSLKLTASNHTLILGARGSGKTTLLKMVSKRALDLWDDTTGSDWKKKIDFTGIYIPADAIWESMLVSIKKILHDKSIASQLMQAVFSTNVYMAIAQSIHDCISSSEESFRQLHITPEAYRLSVQEVAVLWDIELVSDSFLSLKHSLSLRLLQLQKIVSLLSYDLISENNIKDMLLDDLAYVGKPLFESVSLALTAVNRHADQSDYKWALLFDEFEIAPEEILQQLLQQMRAGGDKQHLLFKVSLAPCGALALQETSYEVDPVLVHDCQQITLWYGEKAKARKFCESICVRYLNHCEHKSFNGTLPSSVFGDSPYFRDDSESNDANDAILSWKKDFEELKTKDLSFKKFLDRRNIDTNNLDKTSSSIRKIAPLVSFRNAFPHKNGQVIPWRKPIKTPYSGWQAIVAISEGNPRWLMGILTAMMDKVTPTNIKSKKIPRTIQREVLYQFSGTFNSILMNTPAKQFNESIKTDHSVNEILKKLGDYFKKQLLFANFNDNPSLAFTVDKKIDQTTENCLRIAINHGALICLDEPDRPGGYKTLKSKTMRLSYLLAPHFSLIPRKGNSVQLSTILSPSESKKTSEKIETKQKKSSENDDYLFSIDELI